MIRGHIPSVYPQQQEEARKPAFYRLRISHNKVYTLFTPIYEYSPLYLPYSPRLRPDPPQPRLPICPAGSSPTPTPLPKPPPWTSRPAPARPGGVARAWSCVRIFYLLGHILPAASATDLLLLLSRYASRLILLAYTIPGYNYCLRLYYLRILSYCLLLSYWRILSYCPIGEYCPTGEYIPAMNTMVHMGILYYCVYCPTVPRKYTKPV